MNDLKIRKKSTNKKNVEWVDANRKPKHLFDLVLVKDHEGKMATAWWSGCHWDGLRPIGTVLKWRNLDQVEIRNLRTEDKTDTYLSMIK